jgi:hypothetical protein
MVEQLHRDKVLMAVLEITHLQTLAAVAAAAKGLLAQLEHLRLVVLVVLAHQVFHLGDQRLEQDKILVALITLLEAVQLEVLQVLGVRQEDLVVEVLVELAQQQAQLTQAVAAVAELVHLLQSMVNQAVLVSL